MADVNKIIYVHNGGGSAVTYPLYPDNSITAFNTGTITWSSTYISDGGTSYFKYNDLTHMGYLQFANLVPKVNFSGDSQIGTISRSSAKYEVFTVWSSWGNVWVFAVEGTSVFQRYSYISANEWISGSIMFAIE